MIYLLVIYILMCTGTHALFSASLEQNELPSSITYVPKDISSEALPITTLLGQIIQELNSSSLKSDTLLGYLTELIQYSVQEKKELSELKSMIKLFHNRLKGLEYIPAHRFNTFLHALPTAFTLPEIHKSLSSQTTLFYGADAFDDFTSLIKKELISNFSQKFDDFKKNPDLFLTTIAREINQKVEQEKKVEDLRSLMMRILETLLGKIVWSPDPNEAEKTWNSVKTISEQLSYLLEANIISDVEALDDLLWSLVHRYCYFLELVGTLLPISFYEKALNELENEPLLITFIEDDELLKSKATFLKEALLHGKKRAATHADVTINTIP